jgi:hypothetical protein
VSANMIFMALQTRTCFVFFGIKILLGFFYLYLDTGILCCSVSPDISRQYLITSLGLQGFWTASSILNNHGCSLLVLTL